MTQIEGNDLRDCIDKSFDAGYNEAVRKAVEWLNENWTSFVNYDDEDGVVYYWNLTDKFKEFMETFDNKTCRERYMTNNEIDKNKKEILGDRLKHINDTISRIDFQRSIYGDDFMSMKYNKLISQKEKIENILNHSEK